MNDKNQKNFQNVARDFLVLGSVTLIIVTGSIEPGNLTADMNQAISSQKRNLFYVAYAVFVGSMVFVVAILLAIKTEKKLCALVKEYYRTEVSYLFYLMLELAIIGAGMQVIS